MPQQFKIYSSSAGSGKTYHLTKEYLKLALQSENPGYYRSILAITFTNDAANEMKERILAALRQFNEVQADARAQARSEELLDLITSEIQTEYNQPDTDREMVRARAQRTFEQILYNYSEFAVSTIDAFVNKVVTAFTRELNIPYNFEVDLDTTTLLNTAVSMLLDKVNNAPDNSLLAQTLEQYALEKADEGRSWNSLPDELASFANNLLNEQVYEAVAELQKLTLQDFKKIRQDLYRYKKQIEEAVVEAAQAALDLCSANQIEASFLHYKEKGIYGFFNKYVKDFKFQKSNTYAEQTINNDKWCGAKVPKDVEARLDKIKSQIVAYFHTIETIRVQQSANYILITEIIKHLYQVSVLNELEKCIQDIKRDTNLVHISEFNKRITDIVLNEPVPFIYERLGEKYNHILIDEFQDTSSLQWNNLLPLIENSLASGYFNMAVGDAKQAIYRWRGGDMDQILHLYKRNTPALYQNRKNEDLLEARYDTLDLSLTPADLNTNYRSATEIISFNNSFFKFVSISNPAYPMLQSIYDENFKQATPESNNRTGGHIQVIFTHNEDHNYQHDLNSCERTEVLYEGYEKPEVLTYQESTLQIVLQLIRHALAEGYEWQDIAVLSRTNRNSRLVAGFLKEKKFAIISQDSLSLQFAEVVNLVVALFRIFNRPDDTLARAEAMYLFCKVVRNVQPDNTLTQTIATIANCADNTAFFDELRVAGYNLEEKETGNLSIYELTEKIIRVFNLLGKNNECEYLFRFLDVVLEYSLNQSNNLNNFLEYWETHKEKLSINSPKNRNAITITSIHKAKGLAYPVVIIPFADWSVEPQRSALLWSRLPADLPVFHDLPAAVVTMSKRLEETPLQPQYQMELEKTFIENLNMLYVGFTRPQDRLYLIAQKKDFNQGGNQKNISYILYQYLQHQQLWQDDQLCYQLAQGAATQHSSTPVTEQVFHLDLFRSFNWTQRLKLKQHANNVFDFETQQEYRRLNRKLHYALSRITTADDLNFVLKQLVNEGIFSSKETPELRETLKKIINHPEIKRYFSKDILIEKEKEILNVRATRYKPDRIVFDGTKVVLLDFKAPPFTQEHADNLNFYASLFKELFFTEIECVLYFFDVEEVQKWVYEDELKMGV
ncbi:UvrD-helicase domain-containing protein [Adhaeribacter pallidiroseus]|uniref:DNA 3'-5' helicase n=1 Tax=Adhaeribacter pallidiroseus TaxID=2072847 RepID=A0A369QEB2_9BACT|nr:UvrD-helicase domain-containing protein [Adhaeribacter pallidiroseus]RDC62650.1 DNA helicase [Adhaeribacter pallidiroseus]